MTVHSVSIVFASYNKDYRLNSTIFSIKRGLLKGMIAKYILLNGAKPNFSSGNSHSWSKFGNFHSAYLDFYSVSPSNVRQYELPNEVSLRKKNL